MKNRKGFTLIEILAVIIIMGIIMIIAIPSVTKYIFKTDRQVYVSNLSAYAETIRAKYEMREYGSYLQDNEIMVVPIKTVILEKGDNGESPYGEYDLERSYVIVVPENNKYNFYITAIDDTNTGIIEANINTMDESSIKSEINTPIQTVSSFEATGTIYKFNGSDYRKTENRDIEGEDVNTSPDMKTYVFKYLGVEPENTSGIYKITLDNQGATTHGTEFIYEYYSVGWYSDSEGTTTIRTITPPFKNGYAFNGYYTGANGTGQLIINATGIIVLGTEKTFTTNGTLYAKWTECENGYYSNDSLICSICPEGYRDGTTVTNKTAENKCLKNVGDGKYIKNARDVNPSTCGANTFANAHTVTYGGTSVCPACTTLGSIYTASDGGTKDTGCYSNVPVGKYIKNGKDTAYSTCNANNYSNGAKVYYGQVSSCIPCVTLGLQYTKSAGGTADTGCYMTVSAGKYKTVATGITTANCAANKYSVEHTSYYKSTDENSCKACPSGYTSAEGSTAKTSCKITCSANTRVTTADGKCTTTCSGSSIAQHTVAAGSTSAACTACTNGTGVASWGTGCTVNSCNANYYKNGNACTACPSGYTSSAGSTAKSACKITCGANTRVGTADGKCTTTCSGSSISQHTVSAGNTSPTCSACSNSTGVYSWGTGCTVNSCNGGYAKSGNSCVACTAGTTSSNGNTGGCSACTNGTGVWSWSSGCSISTCAAGYGKSGNSCVACAAGTTSGNGNTGCSACSNATGVYSWSSGCNIATCAAGYGKSGNSCVACKAGTTSGNGNTGCSTCSNATGVWSWSSGCNISTCAAGYGKSGNSCVPCGAGTTSGNGNTGCSACSNNAGVYSWSSGCNINQCNANYYKSGNSCLACPSGQSSSIGSTSCVATTTSFSSTGGVQSFCTSVSGTYKLEVWGAQGGKGAGRFAGGYGGKGGYSYGNVTLSAGSCLYVVIGTRPNGTNKGGYNGGGDGTELAGTTHGAGGGGGGATHIATTNRGELKNYKDYKSEVLIVAGGGGGAAENGRAGGVGGGLNGGAGTGGVYVGQGGTQTGPGARGDTDCTKAGFGYGGSSPYGNELEYTWGSGGGGGGYYGGGASSHKRGGGEEACSGGGGGSGYIGGVSGGSTTAGEREGNGKAKITFIG